MLNMICSKNSPPSLMSRAILSALNCGHSLFFSLYAPSDNEASLICYFSLALFRALDETIHSQARVHSIDTHLLCLCRLLSFLDPIYVYGIVQHLHQQPKCIVVHDCLHRRPPPVITASSLFVFVRIASFTQVPLQHHFLQTTVLHQSQPAPFSFCGYLRGLVGSPTVL